LSVSLVDVKMDPIHSDPRFSKLGKERKFLSVSKKHKKVKIDKRFQSLFSNDKFVSKCTVDKRGRPKNLSSKESYEKFYDLEETDTSDDSDDEPKDDEENEEENLTINLPSAEDPVIESDIKSKLLSSNIDYARGEADLYSDSSSEEDSDSEEEAEQEEEDTEFFDKWGELDGEAERTEDATDRLAVCNMDWDRVGADDIFLVLSSFCPAGGSVASVQVFLSDFGKERLEEEKTLGPRELRQLRGEEGEEEEDDEEEVTGVVDKKESLKRAAAAMDRVRKYQVARLKYYYAVAKFDSIETANHVYTECDGMEYELSATRLDLRFIPAEMSFSTPSSSCMSPPNPDKYQPKAFCTTALQQGKVELTWDEDNQERAKAIKEAFNMEEGKEVENLGDLIGSASEDEEDEIGDGSDEEASEKKGSISKYRALLADLGDKNENQTDEGDMEVTWKDEDSGEEKEEMTPWDKYLKKKKEKKKKKIETLESGSDDPPEGVDMSDPFFAEELEKTEQKKKHKKKKTKEVTNYTEENDDKLALMVMDSDDEKDHFNFKDIVESETKSVKSKKKWKKKKKQLEIPEEDSFNVNVSDSRFSALFSRPEFNIDPTDSNFKKTKNMEKIIEEKQKRIAQADTSKVDQSFKKQKLDPDVSSSLKSVKNKWKKNAKKGKKV